MSSPRQSGPSEPQERQQRQHRQLQLTEEEKAVLVECRRNSIARGLPLGVGALLTLRWFVQNGRVPSHVTRWTSLYYTGAFMGAFFVGVASYKQTCINKIMALDNSFLKSQLQKDLARQRGYGNYGDEEGQSPAHQQPRDHPPSLRRPRSPTTKHTPPPDTSLPEGPTLNTGYDKDLRGETREEPLDQPDAFGGSQCQLNHPVQSTDQQEPSRPRGRSYDELRESARKRYQDERGDRKEQEEDWRQQPHRKVVRKNKYGDDIEE